MDARTRTNPFPGLRPFMQEEADLFFGRDRQSDELVRRLASRRFLAVVGTSGSGKSSLVRAGLLPSLEGGFMAGAGAHWRVATLRPQDDPIGFLARAIVETGALAHLDIAQPAAAGVIETTLRRSSLGLVEAVRLARLEPHENVLILVDQFEELFRFADLARQRGAGDEAPAFVKLLLEAARQTAVPVYVVITMRSDFLGDCARFRDLPEAISDSQYLIPRLTRDDLQAVITGPIGVRGGRIAPGLLQRLLNDVGDDMDQLPVLQHALMRAWDHWERHDPEARSIDLNDLEAIGGMAQALSRHADEAFRALTSDRERTIAERLFKCLTERGSDNREIRRPTQLARIAAIANVDAVDAIPVIDVFRAPGRSFLMPPHGVALKGDSAIDISHESLIRQWGRLRSWVEEEAQSRAMYLRLVEAAQLRRAGKARLWGEPDLTYARQWKERESPNPTWAERYDAGLEDASAFLRDSEVAHATEVEEERRQAEGKQMARERELGQAKALAEAQRQRADEQSAARAKLARMQKWILGIALLLFMALASAAWSAFNAITRQREAVEAKQGAERALRLATSRELVGAATSNLAWDSELSLILAMYSVSTTRSASENVIPEALGALHSAILGSHARLTLSGHHSDVRSVAWSPDGKHVATASEEGSAKVWDATNGRELLSLPNQGSRVYSIAWSPDGTQLAGATESATKLWDPATGRELLTLSDHGTRVYSVAWSPDGKRLATAGDDHTTIVWDAATGKKLLTLHGHGATVFTIAWRSDGKRIATASEDRTARVWNANTGRELLSLPRQGSTIYGIAWSPDGKRLATASEHDSATVWDSATGRKLLTLSGHQTRVYSVAWSPDGERLATASQDKTARVWDSATGKELVTLSGHHGDVYSVAWSPNGERLATGSTDDTAKIWDPAVGEELAVLSLSGPVVNIDWNPDGIHLAAASGVDLLGYSFVNVWDTTKNDTLLWGMHSSAVINAVWSPDGKRLATASLDKTAKVWVWEMSTPKELLTLSEHMEGDTTAIGDLAWSPDSKRLVTTGGDQAARVWDSATGKNLFTLVGHDGMVYAVAWSPDGERLATGSSDGTAKVWDASTGKELVTLSGHSRTVANVAWSPDSKRLATAGQDQTARVWDLATAKNLIILSGHDAMVHAVAWSPDGKRLATGSADGTAKVWDASTGKELVTLSGQSQTVMSVAWSPDSKRLATGSFDNTLVIYEMDIDRLMALGRQRTTRSLTIDECRRYLHVDKCPPMP